MQIWFNAGRPQLVHVENFTKKCQLRVNGLGRGSILSHPITLRLSRHCFQDVAATMKPRRQLANPQKDGEAN